MQHCFPNYQHENEFLKALAAETVKLLEASFQVHPSHRPHLWKCRLSSLFKQHAWANLSTKGLFANFVPAANALDRLESDAEDRLAECRRSGQPPPDFISSVFVLLIVSHLNRLGSLVDLDKARNLVPL